MDYWLLDTGLQEVLCDGLLVGAVVVAVAVAGLGTGRGSKRKRGRLLGVLHSS
jgi:hypothetical protein